MKRLATVLPLVVLLAPGCSSSAGSKPQQAAAENEKKPTAGELKEAEDSRKLVETVRTMAGLPATPADDEPRQEWDLVKDPATGRMLQRVPKGQTLHVVNGRVVSDLLNPRIASLELVREDESFY